MKVIVTHTSPDLDAITSVWLIKRFLNGWEDAIVKFVSAGDRIDLESSQISPEDYTEAIEIIGDDEVIHVDTGLGPLDHHQIESDRICGASQTFEFVKKEGKIKEERIAAISRMIRVVVDVDHFKEVYRPDPIADYQEFDLDGIIEGLKYKEPGQDQKYVDFSMECLDAIMYNFENRIWAEKEMEEKGQTVETKIGKVLAIETINDSVIKLAQKMGYDLVVKKAANSGNIRVKASPKANIDLTPLYNELKKLDPQASWFLHINKKMLLNGTSKNTKMIPSRLSTSDIIDVIKKIYG